MVLSLNSHKRNTNGIYDDPQSKSHRIKQLIWYSWSEQIKQFVNVCNSRSVPETRTHNHTEPHNTQDTGTFSICSERTSAHRHSRLIKLHLQRLEQGETSRNQPASQKSAGVREMRAERKWGSDRDGWWDDGVVRRTSVDLGSVETVEMRKTDVKVY